MKRTVLGICLAMGMTAGAIAPAQAGGFDTPPPAVVVPPPPPPEPVQAPNYTPFVVFLLFAAMGLPTG